MGDRVGLDSEVLLLFFNYNCDFPQKWYNDIFHRGLKICQGFFYYLKFRFII